MTHMVVMVGEGSMLFTTRARNKRCSQMYLTSKHSGGGCIVPISFIDVNDSIQKFIQCWLFHLLF